MRPAELGVAASERRWVSGTNNTSGEFGRSANPPEERQSTRLPFSFQRAKAAQAGVFAGFGGKRQ